MGGEVQANYMRMSLISNRCFWPFQFSSLKVLFNLAVGNARKTNVLWEEIRNNNNFNSSFMSGLEGLGILMCLQGGPPPLNLNLSKVSSHLDGTWALMIFHKAPCETVGLREWLAISHPTSVYAQGKIGIYGFWFLVQHCSLRTELVLKIKCFISNLVLRLREDFIQKWVIHSPHFDIHCSKKETITKVIMDCIIYIA